MTSSNSDRFYKKLFVATLWTYKWKTVCCLCGTWEFALKNFSIKYGVAGQVMQL